MVHMEPIDTIVKCIRRITMFIQIIQIRYLFPPTL